MEAPISGDETRQASVAWLEFAPGGTNARHTHPGDCYATVIEGSIELRIDGQPARVYKAGEAYNVARGLVHEMQNVGQAPARMVVTFIVDKGKPVRQAAQ
jgi:quercetin dioxygenase-like cupin family protein